MATGMVRRRAAAWFSHPRYPGFAALTLGFRRRRFAAGRIDTPALLYALTDEQVMQSITAQHVVMQPSRGRIEMFVPRRLLSG